MAYKRAERKVNMDPVRVREALEAIIPPDELFEIRIIDEKWNKSGYFVDKDIAVNTLSKTLVTDNANVYITLNHIKSGCKSRKQRDRFMENVTPTTSDGDIDYYQYLMFDFDPVRVSGVSSSESELSAAAIVAATVIGFLRDLGFPEPIQAMSGNGYHALYWLESLPVTQENTQLIKKVLQTMNQQCGNDACHVDETTFNPARVCKLYGTIAQKGSSTDERPHRMSKLIKIPEDPVPVSRKQLEEIAAMWHDQKASNKVDKISVPTANNPDKVLTVKTVPKRKEYGIEDPCAWLDSCGVAHSDPIDYEGGIKIILDHCAFDSSHTGSAAAVFMSADGVLGYKCQHFSCADYHFKEFLQKVDPERFKQYATFKAVEKKDQYVPLSIVSAFDLNSHEYAKPDYIVDGILYPGLTIFAGPPKYGKSYLSLDLACSVASGSEFLGKLTKQGNVLYLDLEGTEWRTNERLAQLGYDLCPDNLDHTYKADTVDQHLIQQLTDQIEAASNPKLMIIDTMARIKGKLRRGEDGYSSEYRFLFPLHELALQKSIAIVCVTHTRKGNGLLVDDPMEMIIGSQAQYGTADGGWVLTGKRDESTKVLHCAGRDYEAVDLSIDFSGGKWLPQGTVEEMEQKRAAIKYKDDPVVKTIVHLVKSSGGKWCGTMQELYNEIITYTEEYPAPDPTRLASIVKKYLPLLKKNDSIITLVPDYSRKKDGKSRKEYTFKHTGFLK